MSFIERSKVEGMIEEMERERRTAEMNFHRFDAALMALRALLEEAKDTAPDIAPTGEGTPTDDDTSAD